MNKNQLASISYLRIIATLSVIWLHACSTICDNPDLFEMTSLQSDFFNAASQMMCWAVPVFFMITGILLLNPSKEIKAKDSLLYVRRIVFALLLFGIPFAILKLIPSNGFSISTIGLALKSVLENTGFAHLWYLYSLIGIYLILPVLRYFIKLAKKEEIILVLAALFVLDFVFPFISSLCNIHIAFYIPLQYPVFYLFLGYELYLHKDIFTKYKKWIVAVVIIIIVFIWVANYLHLRPEECTAYSSPLIAILSAGILLLFILHNFKYNRKIWSIDRLCFGVYLIHPVFIHLFYRVFNLTPLRLVIYPLGTIVLFIVFAILSFASSWVLRKIPILKKYVL